MSHRQGPWNVARGCVAAAGARRLGRSGIPRWDVWVLEEVPGQLEQPAGVEHVRNRSSAKGRTGSISLNAQKCSEVVTLVL